MESFMPLHMYLIIHNYLMKSNLKLYNNNNAISIVIWSGFIHTIEQLCTSSCPRRLTWEFIIFYNIYPMRTIYKWCWFILLSNFWRKKCIHYWSLL